MPTDEPRFAGFTNTGYFSEPSISLRAFFGCSRHMLRKTVTCFTIGKPASRKRRFIMSLSMPADEPSTPAPTYGMSASSSRPWMVPSSPNVPCSTGKMTSTLMEFAAAWVSGASLSNGISDE